jgi:alpha-L-rhamnosidase
LAGDDRFEAWLNGQKLGTGGTFKTVALFDVGQRLNARRNVLAVSVENGGANPNPTGLIGMLQVEFESGEPLIILTDKGWRSTLEKFDDWEKLDFDDSTWLAAKEIGAPGIQPWGEISMPDDRRLPARYVRKEFAVKKPIARATIYCSGMGISELYVNGKRTDDDVLSPGLSEYDKRVFYVTRDATGLLKRGPNALGVVLGNGRFFAPRTKSPVNTKTYGFPKLLLQLQIEYADGSKETIISDESWAITDQGPIRANNEFDGEEYDARMEMPRWAEPGFKADEWRPAMLVSAPGGELCAQMIEPIRVTQTLKPISVKEVSPGVHIFDMGQNMVGWCRLHVAEPSGASVKLRHAETLKPDGHLYLDNIRGALVTDVYTLSGKGNETYEPRFTYHGFRFVEVTGFPGKPTLTAIEGKVVHDDLEPAGAFFSSNPLVNQIFSNIVWGVRGNYRSIPTDCPQRDERQGWLGDRSEECRGESYIFNTAPLYAKWLQDMADAQKENGSVSDVCPSYWPFYNDNVTWPSSIAIIPGTLRDQFGDIGPIEKIYPASRKWLLHIHQGWSNQPR